MSSKMAPRFSLLPLYSWSTKNPFYFIFYFYFFANILFVFNNPISWTEVLYCFDMSFVNIKNIFKKYCSISGLALRTTILFWCVFHVIR